MELLTGGKLIQDDECIICTFPKERMALSTSLYNGGYISVEGVFNHKLPMFVKSECDLPGGSLDNYMAEVARSRGLNPRFATGLITSAKMSSIGYYQCNHEGVVVEVVATAGVKGNAARAGEPACYVELSDGSFRPLGGTINIIVLIGANLLPGTMAKCLITVTEAKTAALEELAVTSCYSTGLATGTGTDGAIIVANPYLPTLTDAGTHSKLGEMIATAVKQSVQQSLGKECGLFVAR